MGTVINVYFKNHQSDNPSSFFMPWFPALYERCKNPVGWTYHVSFSVYETDKNFAVKFKRGIGSKGFSSPHYFSNCPPVYKKSLVRLWKYIFNELERYNADTKTVLAALRKYN